MQPLAGGPVVSRAAGREEWLPEALPPTQSPKQHSTRTIATVVYPVWGVAFPSNTSAQRTTLDMDMLDQTTLQPVIINDLPQHAFD